MKKVIKTMSIDLQVWELAKEIAKKEKRSISNLIEKLILEEYERRK